MKFTQAYLVLSFLALTQSLGFAGEAKTIPVSLRVMASNLSSTNSQAYDEPGIRIIKGLKPDVVLVQECNYKSNSSADIQEFVTSTLGEGASFYRESESSDHIPNAILSRYPIIASGEWADATVGDRDFAWARIDIPGNRDLWAISVHMKSGKKDKAKREAQARELMKQINVNIPAADFVVLGGDSNASSKSEYFFSIFAGEDKETQGAATKLSQSAFPSKYTPGEENTETLEATNMTNRYPYDVVLADEDLNKALVAVTFAPAKPSADDLGFAATSGLVFDSTVFPRLDLVAPIQKEDSRAGAMQHLGVMKQFLIQVPASEIKAQRVKKAN